MPEGSLRANPLCPPTPFSKPPQNLKIPIRLFFLSDTVWQIFFSLFILMKFVWGSWASGYQTHLNLCFVGKLLPD